MRIGLHHDVLGVLVAAGVGAVHGLHHLAVEAARTHAQLVPQLLALLRSPLTVSLVALLPTEVIESRQCDFLSQLEVVLTLASRSR